MKFKPTANCVVVKVEAIEKPTMTASGLHLPPSVEPKKKERIPNIGEVIAVGKQVIELGEIKVGDKVVFSEDTTIEIPDPKRSDLTYLLMDASVILTVLVED